MKTVILCGGRGTRLQPLTNQIPKPLIPLQGQPILQHLVSSYIRKGFREFVLCIGYRGEMIQEFFCQTPLDAAFEFSQAGERASMLARLHQAQDLMGDRAFIAYGDTLIDVNLPAMLADHQASGAKITITTAKVKSPFGLVTADGDRWVSSFKEKPLQVYYVGHMLLERSVLEHLDPELLRLPDGEGLVQLFGQLIAQRQLRMYAYPGPQITFNTPQELDQAERDFVAFFHPAGGTGLSLARKKVLVTGGSGFIGSHLCRRLVEAGAEVSVLVKYYSVIDNIRIVGFWEHITPIEADLRNPDSLRQIQRLQPDIIFHLAAYNHVGDSFLQVSEAMECNAKGTANLFESYEDYQRLIYISTSEVYGLQASVPFQEQATPFPLSPYAVGKYAGELYARMKHHSVHKPVVVLRPFNAYGPYQSPRAVIAELIIKCLRGEDIITTAGRQTREFNFVENLVDGFILAATCPEAVGEVINLGCGVETSIRDLVHRIHTLTDSQSQLRVGELPDRPGEIWRMCADNQKAQQLLGWSPQVDLDQGLQLTIEWFRRYLAQFSDLKSPLRALSHRASWV
ncbi:GDP-mannose 4,6-dehydratase [Neosynechococcus sphagnicola]|uniref:GDP-mannose 4,6-dehydratase n=1 Tax=Neosynechococcus sphagnicola TaxID=1501145 RepID=UPI00068A95C5|nr:GDP-mannose 4,6-dehydratase [Neosynechococcus sphagnicola]